MAWREVSVPDQVQAAGAELRAGCFTTKTTKDTKRTFLHGRLVILVRLVVNYQPLAPI